MKSFGLTSLGGTEQAARIMMKKMQTYGLACTGHVWKENLQDMGWLAPKDELCKPENAFWAIMGPPEAFTHADTRYGLSLLALCLQARKGKGFPIVILQTAGDLMSAQMLPTPLQHAIVFSATDAATPAKLVAKAHLQVPDLKSEYYLDMVGNPQFGQWFEVHPAEGEWPGIIFGVDEGEIKFQAVGPAGGLPKTSTLNYPMQGLHIEFIGKRYTAWSVRNGITVDRSYFVKVEGAPAAILFGAFSEESEAQMYHIELK